MKPYRERSSKNSGPSGWRPPFRWAFALGLLLACVVALPRLGRPRAEAQPAGSTAHSRPSVTILHATPDFVPASDAQVVRDGSAAVAEAPLVHVSAGNATVTGHVVDASGGVVVGATVVARGIEPTSNTSAAALSERDGSFRLDLPAGPLELSAHAEAYSRMVRRIQAPARDVTLVLAPGSGVSGHVVAEGTGAPIAGARIAAINVNGVLLPGVESESRADGSFRIAGLPAGGYTLWARAEGWQDRRIPIVLALDDAVDATLSLGRAAVLQASVSASGRPCEGASVLLDGPVAASGVAAANGKLTIANAAPGRYRASVKCANALPHDEELELTAQAPVERHFELDSGLTLRGTVQRANGQPFPGAAVLAVPVRADTDATPSREAKDRGASSESCVADATGAFACGGLRPDVYEVGIEGAGPERCPKVRVELRTGAEPAVVLRAHASGTIRVSLGGAVGASAVVLAAAEGSEPGAGVLRGSARDGRIVFEDVKLGRYRVYLGSSERSTAQVTLERDAQVADVELGVPETCSIFGSVVDEAGVPVPDAWVRASSDDDFTHARETSGAPTLSDIAGAFSISGLFDGEYRLSVSSGDTEATLAGVRCAGRRGPGVKLVLRSVASSNEP